MQTTLFGRDEMIREGEMQQTYQPICFWLIIIFIANFTILFFTFAISFN